MEEKKDQLDAMGMTRNPYRSLTASYLGDVGVWQGKLVRPIISPNMQGREFWETRLSQAELTSSKATAVGNPLRNSDEDWAQRSICGAGNVLLVLSRY